MNHKSLVLIAILLLSAVLRVYALNQSPSGLNADEAAIGYNAYSLLTTGKDEDGETWPIVFKSFGDYKPGGYFYLVLPFVKTLGLNIWAVRLPSAILGIISVWLIYLLAGEIFDLSKFLIHKSKFQLFSALLLSISPWHLQFSRGGWETNAATAMLLGGVYLFLKSLKNRLLLPFAFLLFTFSMYTYQSTRLIAPLLGLSLIILFWNNFWPPTRTVILSGFLLLLLLLPLGLVILSPSGLSRLSGVGLSADLGPINRVNQLRGQHPDPASLAAKVFHTKITAYLFLLGKNYLDHFNGNFLFISGDPIQRNKVPEMGQLYLIEIPVFLLGIWLLLKNLKQKGPPVILAWLLIAPTAAALTFQTPHALRSLNMVIPSVLILALGLSALARWIRSLNKPLVFVSFSFLLTIGYLWCFTHYLNEYYLHYPKTYPAAWEYGFDQVAAVVQPLMAKYDRVVFTDVYDQPYIEMLFFLKYPPDVFQKEVILTPRDNFGFSTVRTFGKFEFTPVVWNDLKSLPNTLIVGTPAEIPPTAHILNQILFPGGQPAFVIADTET